MNLVIAVVVVLALIYCGIRFWLLPWLFTSGVVGEAVFGKERYQAARQQSGGDPMQAISKAKEMVDEEHRQWLIAKDRELSARTGVPMAVFEGCRRQFPTYIIDEVKPVQQRGVTVYEVQGASGASVDIAGNAMDVDYFVRSYYGDGRPVE